MYCIYSTVNILIIVNLQHLNLNNLKLTDCRLFPDCSGEHVYDPISI